MNETIQANLIEALPNVAMEIPWFGSVDLTVWIVAVAIFFVVLFFFKALQAVILKKLHHLSQRTETTIDDTVISAFESIRSWVYVLIAFWCAIQVFTLPESVALVTKGIVLAVIVWQLIEIVSTFVDYFATHVLEKDEDGDGEPDPNSATASNMVALMARIILFVLGGLFILSNLGIEITALIAGLGIGGIAVAFALQGILSDLFSSFSIYFDKPFRIGDFIVIGEHSGTVKKIGIKTTRIHTLQGEELVVSNTELTSTRVQNFKKMQERRIEFKFGITYETPHEKVREIKGIIGRIFESVEGARLDRVHFVSFGDSALLFDVVYFVASADYTEYLNIQEQFNHELMSKFAEIGIDFAYPTQTLYLKGHTVD